MKSKSLKCDTKHKRSTFLSIILFVLQDFGMNRSLHNTMYTVCLIKF